MTIAISSVGAGLYPEDAGRIFKLESTKVSFSMTPAVGAQARVQLTNAPGLFLVEIRTNETAAATVSVQFKVGNSTVDAGTSPNITSWNVSAAGHGLNRWLFYIPEGSIEGAAPYLSIHNGGGILINVTINKVD